MFFDVVNEVFEISGLWLKPKLTCLEAYWMNNYNLSRRVERTLNS